MSQIFLKLSAIVLISFVVSCAHAIPFKNCDQDPDRQKLRSEELQKIVSQDQADRENANTIDWSLVSPRDEARRKRVGEIFGEGCFKTAADYSAAALVYQHGNTPDHFYQTFLWAKKAVDLGDVKSKRLMVMGLDRYLVNIGHKQLFATQARKINENPCWCMEPVESTFPAALRSEYAGKTIAEALAWVDSLNEDQPACKPAKFCAMDLKDSPAGTILGFW